MQALQQHLQQHAVVGRSFTPRLLLGMEVPVWKLMAQIVSSLFIFRSATKTSFCLMLVASVASGYSQDCRYCPKPACQAEQELYNLYKADLPQRTRCLAVLPRPSCQRVCIGGNILCWSERVYCAASRSCSQQYGKTTSVEQRLLIAATSRSI